MHLAQTNFKPVNKLSGIHLLGVCDIPWVMSRYFATTSPQCCYPMYGSANKPRMYFVMVMYTGERPCWYWPSFLLHLSIYFWCPSKDGSSTVMPPMQLTSFKLPRPNFPSKSLLRQQRLLRHIYLTKHASGYGCPHSLLPVQTSLNIIHDHRIWLMLLQSKCSNFPRAL